MIGLISRLRSLARRSLGGGVSYGGLKAIVPAGTEVLETLL